VSSDSPPRLRQLGSIQYAIHNWFAPLLIGLHPAHTEKIWGKLDTIHWNPTAKGAIDLAVYDAVAQSRNLPLWEMLGGFTDRLPVSWMLGMHPIPEMIKEAEERPRNRASHKVIDPQKDIQVIKFLRENLGPEVWSRRCQQCLYDFHGDPHHP
jgi:L-alanine-DL-glutamate epimerase-like enolase superfamily enzyme